MQLIAHRRNTIQNLLATPVEFGVEVDIRSNGSDLVLHHDPFRSGTIFREWLSYYKHKTLILNVKEEGLETAIIELMTSYGIESYFFLDQSFPFLIKSIRNCIRECSIRISEYESVDTALSLRGEIDWVWLDCFTGNPPNLTTIKTAQEAGYKVCLVSPELQGYDKTMIDCFKKELLCNQINIEAVCTKFPELW